MKEHRFFAAVYDRVMASAEAAGLGDRRRQLLSGATGRVLEVGGGTGLNLAHYTAASEVVVLEPDPAMVRKLTPKLGRAPVPARAVTAGIDDPDLARFGIEDGGFDTIVCTLVLCTVPDLGEAARALHRRLRPDGLVLFLEHVLAPTRGRRAAQRLANPLWGRLAAGCHLDRDPVPALRQAGFMVGDYDRIFLPLGPLAGPGVVGTATVRKADLLVEPGTYPMASGRAR